MKTIDITLHADGTVEVEAVGFKGNSCEAATKAIEQALGMDVSKRRRKMEYYAAATISAQQKVKAG